MGIPSAADFDSHVTIKTWAKTIQGYEYEMDILTNSGRNRMTGIKPTIDEALQDIQRIINEIYSR